MCLLVGFSDCLVKVSQHNQATITSVSICPFELLVVYVTFDVTHSSKLPQRPFQSYLAWTAVLKVLQALERSRDSPFTSCLPCKFDLTLKRFRLQRYEMYNLPVKLFIFANAKRLLLQPEGVMPAKNLKTFQNTATLIKKQANLRKPKKLDFGFCDQNLHCLEINKSKYNFCGDKVVK